MKKYLYIAGLFIAACGSKQMEQKKLTVLSYPNTHKGDVVDDYFGTKVADPYQWLENDTATEVIQWVKEQNKVTTNYLEQIPYREQIKKRLTEIWNFPKYSSPFKEGEWYYFFKNIGLENQSILYRQKGLNGEPEVFLDPNKLSSDGTVSLASFTFSKDHKYCAVGIAQSGSDWNEVFVMDVATKQKTTDLIKWVKFSGATWYKNGFYYSRYDEPKKGKEFSNQNEYMKIYYHTIGQDQANDVLVYEDKAHPLRYFNAGITEDERFMYINISEGTSGNEILIKDLSKNDKQFRVLFKGFENNYSIVDNVGENILATTDKEAAKYRLIEVNPAQPAEANWKTIIPASDDLLEGVSYWGGKLFASYLKDASTRLYKLNADGTGKTEIQLPGIGTASGIYGKKEDTETFYTFTSFTNPGEIYKYDLTTGKSELFRKTEVNFNAADFETKQVFYTSKDGTKVPMFIMHKKGLVLDGTKPTLLYGYGGFNVSLTPSFSVSRIMFLENGGVYAIASLRGGGEYGEDWHKAGMLEKKQNVFDDFISAAEFLISEKYTSSSKLAIHGGSNGGLLVGACMTQRPELFKVAIPAVGVLDMLKYHKFTIGWGWAVEYGSSEKKEQFDYLIKYSPLHNVKEGVNYPATMIMTADHDDRVVPAHSFKFAAELQSKQQKDGNPTLIRIDSKAGHGAGKPTTKLIEDAADMWSFILWNLNAEVR
ncbi:prolyl endopeptidase [Bacteroidetes bacterium UKL13-3]|jgi:prolyl oligopeptidase|nr:prolyl endopeptidase [Bacteroidetes bacterium UKL13-3]HCP93805.1 S9 family peptidase [Bacteroidota bacterium]